MANSLPKKRPTKSATGMPQRIGTASVVKQRQAPSAPTARKLVAGMALKKTASKHNGITRTLPTVARKGGVIAPPQRAGRPSPATKSLMPVPFKDGESGLYEWTGGQYQRFCSGAQWIGNVVDADGGNPAHALDIWTLHNTRKRIEVPHELVNQSQELARFVTNQGAQLASTRDAPRQMRDYLSSRSRQPTYTRVTQDGWQPLGNAEAYVFGDKAFSVSKDELRIMRAPRTSTRKRAGTLAQWREIVKLCKGNPLLILALCAAFASALLHPFGHNAFGVLFVGRSSTGKTTILRLVQALVDSPNEIMTWSSTANGLEALASQYSHMPLMLDEIGLASPDVMSDAAYRLTSSSGKARAARDGKLASPVRISSVSISSGEESVIDRIEDTGRRAKVGQFARFISLTSDFQHGAFANIHGQKNGAAFAEKLNRMLRETHGVAWEAFVKYLAENIHVVKKLHTQNEAEIKTLLTEGIDFNVADGVCARVLDSFALMVRAGIAAKTADVLPLTNNEIIIALRQCLKTWGLQYQKYLLTPNESIRNDVGYFFRKYRHDLHRLSDYGNADRKTSIGFTCSLKDGNDVYLIFPESMDALKKKHGQEKFHRALLDAKWLLPGSGNRPTQQRWLPGGGRYGMYVFSKSAVLDQ